MLDHGGEEMEHFRVSRVLRICFVVVDKQLERRQELLVENSERFVLLFQDVSLDQLENVSSDGLHRFDHGVVLGLLADHGIAHLLAIKIVDFEQVLKYVLEVVEVDEASAFGHSLVDLHDVVNSFDVLVTEELVDVCVGVGELGLEFLVRVMQQVIHVDILLVWVLLLTNHPAHAFVDQQLLMRLQVFQVGWQVLYDGLDEGLCVTVVHLDKHLFG